MGNSDQQPVVLVTGGTRNIGRGIAEAFLADGARVVVCGRRAPGDLPAVGDNAARFIACDVRRHESVAELMDTITNEYGRLDVLVNNAGGSPPTDAAETDPGRHEAIIALNLLAPLHCAQAAWRIMREQEGGGAIINIASVGGDRPSPGTAAYGAAKAGLLHLTRSLAMEWGPRVRVNAIIAGLIATDSAHDHYGGEEGIRRIDKMLPLGRMGTPEDIGQACRYLASPQAAYVSGAELAVHGGGEYPVFLYLAKEDKT